MICLCIIRIVGLLSNISIETSDESFIVYMDNKPWYSKILNLDSSGNIIGATGGGPGGGGGGGPNNQIVPIAHSTQDHDTTGRESSNCRIPAGTATTDPQPGTITVKYEKGMYTRVEDRDMTTQERTDLANRLNEGYRSALSKGIIYPNIKEAKCTDQELFFLRRMTEPALVRDGYDLVEYHDGMFTQDGSLYRINNYPLIKCMYLNGFPRVK